jgi:glutathione-specific gamma-glutamylcyclotransferase
LSLTRETILRGDVARMIQDGGEGHRVLSDEARKRSLNAALEHSMTGEDVWVFGYGSLIWNPAFHYVERVTATLPNYHRAFCLWTHLGRGTPECPGLTLGLKPGGKCQGVAFRIAAEAVETELDIVWRREMVTGAYCPTWVQLESAPDQIPIDALTFVMDPENDRYADYLSAADTAAAIAKAAGRLGTCREYLFNTVAHLQELGLPDPHLEALVLRVRELTGE